MTRISLFIPIVLMAALMLMSFTTFRQGRVIQQQRAQIWLMSQNPACMIEDVKPRQGRTFDGDKYIPVPDGPVKETEN